LDPRFAGSNPTEDSGFLRAIKICSVIYFVVRFYSMLKNRTGMKRDTL
jgi:hypothetical protein